MNVLTVDNTNVFVFNTVDRVEIIIRVKSISRIEYDSNTYTLRFYDFNNNVMHSEENVNLERYNNYRTKFVSTDDRDHKHDFRYADIARAQQSLYANGPFTMGFNQL